MKTAIIKCERREYKEKKRKKVVKKYVTQQ